MKLKKFPELHVFLSTHFSDSDPETDDKTMQKFIQGASSEAIGQLSEQIQALVENADFSPKFLEEMGTETNRWFADSNEARRWLDKIGNFLRKDAGAESIIVKDSNGTVLNEGDSVSVIKDLKVKGGSSDLKRGTLIKKIHLVGDPEVVECRVDGSTLVLKTCFLRKS